MYHALFHLSVLNGELPYFPHFVSVLW